MPAPKYRLHASRVDRIAIVDRPCVPDAEIILFKRKQDGCPDGAMPISCIDHEWNQEEALKRVAEWATENGIINKEKYNKAFMMPDPENPALCKMPFVDIIEGNTVVIPKAIFAIVRDVVNDKAIEKKNKLEMLERCKEYYDLLEIEFPEVLMTFCEKGITPGFNAQAAPLMIEGAVGALSEVLWDVFHSEDVPEDKVKRFKKEFATFRDVVNSIIVQLSKGITQDVQPPKLTNDEIIAAFNLDLNQATVYTVLTNFMSALKSLVMSRENLEDPDGAIKGVMDSFEAYMAERVLPHAEIVQKAKAEYEEVVIKGRKQRQPGGAFEKIGRKIAIARLQKLKEAIEVLRTIVDEAEGEKQNKEAGQMDVKEMADKLTKLAADVEGLSTEVGLIRTALKDKGIPVTEAEKTQAQEALKKVEAEKIEAEKKAKEEADKLALEKRCKDAGLDSKATIEEIEKKEKETADAKAKFEQEMPGRIDKVEKAIGQLTKFVETVGKRFGMKASMDADPGSNQPAKDMFGDALAGKK